MWNIDCRTYLPQQRPESVCVDLRLRTTKAPVHPGPLPSSYSSFEASSMSFFSVRRSKVGRLAPLVVHVEMAKSRSRQKSCRCPSSPSRSQSLLMLKVAAGVMKPGLFIWSDQGDVLPGAAGRSMARRSLMVWELFLLLIRQVWTFEVDAAEAGKTRRSSQSLVKGMICMITNFKWYSWQIGLRLKFPDIWFTVEVKSMGKTPI